LSQKEGLRKEKDGKPENVQEEESIRSNTTTFKRPRPHLTNGVRLRLTGGSNEKKEEGVRGAVEKQAGLRHVLSREDMWQSKST